MSGILFLFITMALTIRNYLLRTTPFTDWDEGIYAQVAREILRNGQLVTMFNGGIWLNKPPLVHTIIAGIFALFGENEFAARFIMVLAAVFLSLLTFLLTRKIYYSLFPEILNKINSFERTIILTTPVLTLVSAPVLLERSTMLNTDTFLGIGWVGYFLFRRNFWLKLLFLCIGVMSKSLLGFYPLLFEIFLIRRSNITMKNIVMSTSLIVLPLSWHIYSFYRFGSYFLQAHLYDQVAKRVTAPIELHFGNFYFYPLQLWHNVDGAAFFMFAGYLFVTATLLKKFADRSLRNMDADTMWWYIALISPIPYFILLTFMKSKISWYMVSVLPLFCLIIPYFFMVLKDVIIKRLATVFIFFFFLVPFLAQTIMLKPTPDRPPRTTIAQCISGSPHKTISVAVDKAERDVRNVLEAAQLQTETSFIYGGSPSFVFYANKKVTYHYSLDSFAKNLNSAELLMISNEDLEATPDLKERLDKLPVNGCSDHGWVIFKSRYQDMQES